MTEGRPVVHLWSDAQLDQALQEFRRDVPADSNGLATAQAKLFAAIRVASSESEIPAPAAAAVMHSVSGTTDRPAVAPSAPRRQWSRPLFAIPLLAALIIGGLVVPSIQWGGKTGNTANAAAYLRTASQAVSSAASSPGSDQFVHVQTKAWWSAFNGDFVFLNENVIQTWIPADLDAQWVQTREATDNRIWIVGSEDEARAAGALVDDVWPTTSEQAACGDFQADGGTPDCSSPGSWQRPTRDFVDGLPDTADALYQRLAADVPDNGNEGAAELTYAADALTSGALPPAKAAVLYDAMALIPGIAVTDDQANLDGRLGTAFGIDNGDVRIDVIIDRTTGTFIGQRQVLTESRDSAPSGTTITYSSVDRQIVDAAEVPQP